MNAKILFVLFFYGAALTAAPVTRDSYSELRHLCNNHETELQVMQEKLANQEVIIESLQRDQKNTQRLLQEALKSKTSGLDQRLAVLENTLQQVSQENAAYKKHLEKLNEVLMTLHERIAGYETALAQQSGNVTHLQNALTTITEAIQGPIEVPSDANTYKVQSGDSLGKIAVKFGVSLKALREENKLPSDKIIIGQTLLIPAKAP